jgi:hypothetical protein
MQIVISLIRKIKIKHSNINEKTNKILRSNLIFRILTWKLN